MMSHRYLDGNQLSGPIPSSIGSLKKLENLYARFNHDHQNHYSLLLTMASITITRFLQNNQLTGTIPESIGSIIPLTYMYVHHLPA